MTASFRLGRIAGIEIGANWSWLLVVVLLVWSLAGDVFPSVSPGLSAATYLIMAIVAAALFFASLLAHELGHALQARREGMHIEGITLWVFGGVAKFTGRFPSAGAEFRIAGAGPLVSLALGAVFLAVALLLSRPPEVDGVLLWIGEVNLTLLVFNLLPALPLDGGRILRAALWERRRDFGSATRTAAGLGRLFGQLMIAGGVALVIFVGIFSGVWLAFIGWFLLGAAEGEARAAELEGPAGRLRVADVMVRNPVTVAPELTLEHFMNDIFLRYRHTAYPVHDGTRPVGLISFRDALESPRGAWPQLLVRDRMHPTERIPVLPATMSLADALSVLAGGRLHRALVHDDGDFVGLLSITDVARVLEAQRVRR
jgi:Zn-dependent protease